MYERTGVRTNVVFEAKKMEGNAFNYKVFFIANMGGAMPAKALLTWCVGVPALHDRQLC